MFELKLIGKSEIVFHGQEPFDVVWYMNGKLHRENGPAIERINGCKFWYFNDEHHREDGPAVEWADGEKEWFLNGNRCLNGVGLYVSSESC